MLHRDTLQRQNSKTFPEKLETKSHTTLLRETKKQPIGTSLLKLERLKSKNQPRIYPNPKLLNVLSYNRKPFEHPIKHHQPNKPAPHLQENQK